MESEQRTSALQQRLQARREMFMKETGSINNINNTGNAQPIYGSKVNTPSTAPPQPPTNAPRATKDSSIYGNKDNPYGSSNGTKPSLKPEVAPKPRDVSPKPEVVKKPPRQLDGYVGFANLPNQVHRKSVKKGFEFTLLVAGESGLGKSTLINSMFLTDIYSDIYPGPTKRAKQTVQVETSQVLLQESGVNLLLTVVDTPGFGDAIDNSNCWDPVLSYVESQYEEFLEAETKVQRNPNMPDTRVHACLYFIPPSGHGLRPLDIEFMRQLHDKVNIIPVIAKADTLVEEEIAFFKSKIMQQIHAAKIKIYEFPEVEEGEENDKKENRKMKDRVPFAVVGSNTIIDGGDGKMVRGRRYPWGTVDIENLNHCDFVPLRNMLIRSHLQDLKEMTNMVHYENFRCRKLAGIVEPNNERVPNKNPLLMIEEEQKEQSAKLSKMEREMEEVFGNCFKTNIFKTFDKINNFFLLDNEGDLERRQTVAATRLDQQKQELEEKKAAFEQERQAWEQMNNITMDDLKRMSLESLDGKKKKGGLSGVSFRMGK
ncbi:septin-7 [Eurytemora carolleeae]|uniref:septin-7 n=1 Tax=Eurytemora carolleeae TaxID=1294199 RepID=UPI000C78FE4E|nr:septin-7 [Eurytemora carolleeae]|eukprot:XP_023336289.1 septin-7-like [Eurytemora affinis]